MFDDDDQSESFITVLLRQDELGAVIRAQIYLEHELIEFVNSCPTAPGAQKNNNLSFARLVSLAISLGLPKEFERPLRAFARIRNQFAHRLSSELSDDVVKQFCGSFSKKMREMAEGGIDNIVILNTANKTTRETLTSRGLFMMYSWALWYALSKATKLADYSQGDDQNVEADDDQEG